MKREFTIKYTIYSINNQVLKEGTTKVKNCVNEFEAKCKLENYLKKKYPKFNKLVIHKCTDNSLLGMFENLYG